ncbi:hypothetical protein [Bradyrhizobium sp. LVM 105]|uniref:hypothetical protein n=1 Tax=Bradyrhizobium sp. LVM 105 TaxID=2341115 RepID=UPI000F8097CA|nr:hypothetical protein [Bradyrhizobium sp. LVM 105]RTE90670.1 hypothetical protein D6B98_24820 [Bradyrhizobium sp. LVM 105]
MIADNTGFSTGLHTHMALYSLSDNLQKIDANEATGSYDPSLCFTGAFAERPIHHRDAHHVGHAILEILGRTFRLALPLRAH